MKSTIKIEKIEYAGFKLEGVELSQEYTAQDAINLTFAGKSFVRGLIKELPEILEDLEVAFNKFNEIDERVESKDMTKELEDFIKEINENEDNCPFKVVSITKRG